MTWPPELLKAGWSYDLYNDAMMDALAKEPDWVEYVRARGESRASGGTLPVYPNETVLRVQQRINEEAEASIAAQIEQMHVAETGVQPTIGRKRSFSSKDGGGKSVDPDLLITAFSQFFMDAFESIFNTLLAIRGDTELERSYIAAQKDPEANALELLQMSFVTAEHARTNLIGYEDETKLVASEKEEAAKNVQEFQRRKDSTKSQERIAACEAMIEKVTNGVFENGIKTQMGLSDLEAQIARMKLASKERIERIVSKERSLRLIDERIGAMKAFRQTGAPKNALGGGTDYTQLWMDERYRHLRHVALPGGHTPDSYRRQIAILRGEHDQLEPELAKHVERHSKRKQRFDDAKAHLDKLNQMQTDLEKKMSDKEKNVSGFANVGRYLLNAFPVDRDRVGDTVTQVEQRVRWAALMRAFHKPRPGFSRGRAGAGEPPAFLVTGNPRGFSFVDEIAKETFDVAVLPHEANVAAIRIIGARWCSDLAFVRELVRLSIKKAELPAGTIKPHVNSEENLRRTLVLSIRDPAHPPQPATRETMAEHATKMMNVATQRVRIQAFGATVEVAARQLRALLGRRVIAKVPRGPDDQVPTGFEPYAFGSNLIGWDLRLDKIRTRGLSNELVAHLEGVGAALQAILARMGGPPATDRLGGLGSEWARATAKALAAGGHSRQLAIVVDIGYGIGGQTQTNEFFEFDVGTRSPESESALSTLLMYDDPAAALFNLSPTVIHLSGPTIVPLIEFLSAPHHVALALYHDRYHVLYKDDRDRSVVLIDPEDRTSNHFAFVTAISDASKAVEQPWEARVFDNGYRDSGQDSNNNFLVAMARALVLALGVHRTKTEPDYDPILGKAYSENEYNVKKDHASAVSNLRVGFGPICIALAALSHNEHSIAEPIGTKTRRIELWAN